MTQKTQDHALSTSGKVRDFLAMAMMGVKNGDLSTEKAAQIGKLAGPLHTSLYSEAKLATLTAKSGKTPPRLGTLPIGESNVDASAVVRGAK